MIFLYFLRKSNFRHLAVRRPPLNDSFYSRKISMNVSIVRHPAVSIRVRKLSYPLKSCLCKIVPHQIKIGSQVPKSVMKPMNRLIKDAARSPLSKVRKGISTFHRTIVFILLHFQSFVSTDCNLPRAIVCRCPDAVRRHRYILLISIDFCLRPIYRERAPATRRRNYYE